jgi:hypothetical protein
MSRLVRCICLGHDIEFDPQLTKARTASLSAIGLSSRLSATVPIVPEHQYHTATTAQPDGVSIPLFSVPHHPLPSRLGWDIEFVLAIMCNVRKLAKKRLFFSAITIPSSFKLVVVRAVATDSPQQGRCGTARSSNGQPVSHHHHHRRPTLRSLTLSAYRSINGRWVFRHGRRSLCHAGTRHVAQGRIVMGKKKRPKVLWVSRNAPQFVLQHLYRRRKKNTSLGRHDMPRFGPTVHVEPSASLQPQTPPHLVLRRVGPRWNALVVARLVGFSDGSRQKL